MDTTLAPIERRIPVRDIELAIREWPGDARPPFLLVHGLASNARTWEAVARYLNEAGHRIVAVDQRGHGLSDKPKDGYDFENTSADLKALIEALELERPVIAGQSWGGNVVLDFAARYPDLASGIVLVDGGFIDLARSPNGSWEQISVNLKPPALAGTPRQQMLERMHNWRPDWTEEGILNTLANFETLPDDTVRPWLTLDRHMAILRSLWEQDPIEVARYVKTPVLVAVAGHPPGDEERRRSREEQVGRLQETLSKAYVQHFEDAAHDIHVHKPDELASWMLDALKSGFFQS